MRAYPRFLSHSSFFLHPRVVIPRVFRNHSRHCSAIITCTTPGSSQYASTYLRCLLGARAAAAVVIIATTTTGSFVPTMARTRLTTTTTTPPPLPMLPRRLLFPHYYFYDARCADSNNSPVVVLSAIGAPRFRYPIFLLFPTRRGGFVSVLSGNVFFCV